MAEIGEIELVCPVGLKPHDLAHGIHERRLAVGRKAHDLVLVAIVGKAQILRQRLVEDAERMRKIHPPVDGDVLALADAPGGAGEIAEPVDRNDDGLLERRDMKGRGKMREMMLDLVHLATKRSPGKLAANSSGMPGVRRRFLRRLTRSPRFGRCVTR